MTPEQPTDSIGTPRRRRGVPIRALAAAVAAVSTAGTISLLSTDDRDSRADPAEGRTATLRADNSMGAVGEVSVEHGGGLDELAARPDLRAQPPGSAPGPGHGPYRVLVVGQLEDSRLLAVLRDAVVRQAATSEGGRPDRIEIQATSTTVGGPIAVESFGEDLVVAATNHAQLVKLGRDWRTPRTLDVAPAIGALGKELSYSSILKTSPTEFVIPAAFSTKVALVRVDVARWAVTQTRVFADRFAGPPPACQTDAGDIVVASTDHLDLVDGRSLDRKASIDFPDSVGGLACIGDEVWATNFDRPEGVVLAPDSLTRLGRFSWRGRGGLRIVGSAATAEVFGTDPVEGIVFSCQRRSRVCRVSKRLGSKPTDLLRDGDVVFVTLETAKAVAVVNAVSLASQGQLPLPAMPRTLTMLTLT